MNTLEYIGGFYIRGFVQGSVAAFYTFTAGIGPAVLGYSLARWGQVYFRVIPLLFILPAGLWWTFNCDHGFIHYLFGNLLYAAFLIRGLMRKARDREVTFWSLHHFDWITVVVGTVLMWLVYVPPQM